MDLKLSHTSSHSYLATSNIAISPYSFTIFYAITKLYPTTYPYVSHSSIMLHPPQLWLSHCSPRARPRPEAARKKTDIDSQRSSGVSPRPSSPGARNWKSTETSAPWAEGKVLPPEPEPIGTGAQLVCFFAG